LSFHPWKSELQPGKGQNMSEMDCVCKKLRKRKASLEQPYHFIESGLDNVFLVGITVGTCIQCAEQIPEIPNISQLHDKIAETLVTKPAPLLGTEIRFLRKNLALLARDFAKYLDTTPVSISRWENGETVGKENDKLIRYFYLRFKEEKTKSRIEQEVGQLSHTDKPEKALNMNVKVAGGNVTAKFVEACA
jgi:putative zinc finger/helix-turn-helix YgiT family protein